MLAWYMDHNSVFKYAHHVMCREERYSLEFNSLVQMSEEKVNVSIATIIRSKSKMG